MLPSRFLLFSLFCLLCFSRVFTQENSVFPYEIGLNIGKGFIINHNPNMEFITAQHIEKLELYFQKSSLGKKAWESHYAYPKMGVSLSYFSLNNSQHIGDAYSIAPYLNFKLVKTRRFRLGLRTALGLGLIEEPFDVEKNPKHTAIGSRLNFYFSILLRSEFRLSDQIGLGIGVNLSHFSNTSFKKPNAGINVPSIESGLFYKFGKKRELLIAEQTENWKPSKGHWQISGGLGLNQVSLSDERRHLAGALSLSREKRLGLKSSLGGSLDFFQNPGRRSDLAVDSIFIDKGFENTQIGLSLYHLLHIGTLGVITQAGYYIKSEDKSLGRLYHFAGGRVQLQSDFSIYFGLKTHFARAEYFLLGLSYQLSP